MCTFSKPCVVPAWPMFHALCCSSMTHVPRFVLFQHGPCSMPCVVPAWPMFHALCSSMAHVPHLVFQHGPCSPPCVVPAWPMFHALCSSMAHVPHLVLFQHGPCSTPCVVPAWPMFHTPRWCCSCVSMVPLSSFSCVMYHPPSVTYPLPAHAAEAPSVAAFKLGLSKQCFVEHDSCSLFEQDC